MYLTQLILNPRSRAVWRDLADVHAMHRTVMSGFPNLAADGDARGRLGVLYRLESHPRTGEPTVLVQSAIAPNWAQLPQGYLLERAGMPNPDCKEVGAIFARLRPGTPLTFRLRANPTKRVSAHAAGVRPEQVGKRVELRGEVEQLAWLARKGAQHGFIVLSVRAASGAAAIPDVRIRPGGKVVGRRPAGAPMTFAAVTFEGRLRVTDADRFRAALAAGIGPGKAYGFGLLSIAPPPAGVD